MRATLIFVMKQTNKQTNKHSKLAQRINKQLAAIWPNKEHAQMSHQTLAEWLSKNAQSTRMCQENLCGFPPEHATLILILILVLFPCSKRHVCSLVDRPIHQQVKLPPGQFGFWYSSSIYTVNLVNLAKYFVRRWDMRNYSLNTDHLLAVGHSLLCDWS